MRTIHRTIVIMLSLVVAGCATGRTMPRGSEPSGVAGEVLEMQRDWWRALALGDTTFLAAHSADALSLTLSSGRTFDRSGALAQAAAFAASSPPTFGWSDQTVRLVGPDVAIATIRATESVALVSSAY